MKQEQETTLDLMNKRAKFIAEKSQLQIQIGEINQQCARRLPNHVYYDLQQQRQILNRKIANCEQWIVEINAKQRANQFNGNSDKRHEQLPDAARLQLANLCTQTYDKWRLVSEGKSSKPVRDAATKFMEDVAAIGYQVRKLKNT